MPWDEEGKRFLEHGVVVVNDELPKGFVRFVLIADGQSLTPLEEYARRVASIRNLALEARDVQAGEGELPSSHASRKLNTPNVDA